MAEWMESMQRPFSERMGDLPVADQLQTVKDLKAALNGEDGTVLAALMMGLLFENDEKPTGEGAHALRVQMIVDCYVTPDGWAHADPGPSPEEEADSASGGKTQRNSPLITPVLADDVTMRRETKSNAKRREDMERAKRERAHRTAKLDGGETPPHDPMPASNGTGNTEASDWKHSVYIRDQVKRLEQSGTSKDNEKHGKLLISIIHAGFSVNGARDANFELTDDDATAKLRELASAHAATQFAREYGAEGLPISVAMECAKALLDVEHECPTSGVLSALAAWGTSYARNFAQRYEPYFAGALPDAGAKAKTFAREFVSQVCEALEATAEGCKQFAMSRDRIAYISRIFAEFGTMLKRIVREFDSFSSRLPMIRVQQDGIVRFAFLTLTLANYFCTAVVREAPLPIGLSNAQITALVTLICGEAPSAADVFAPGKAVTTPAAKKKASAPTLRGAAAALRPSASVLQSRLAQCNAYTVSALRAKISDEQDAQLLAMYDTNGHSHKVPIARNLTVAKVASELVKWTDYCASVGLDPGTARPLVE